MSVKHPETTLASGRCNFLKIGIGGAALAGVAVTGILVSMKIEGIELDDLPGAIDPAFYIITLLAILGFFIQLIQKGGG